MGKIFRYLYILAFLGLLLIPLFLVNDQRNAKSLLDNRTLAEFPEFESEDFTKGVEKYLQDRIGFRDYMVAGYQSLNDTLSGELTHPLFTYGQDGYIFFKMHDNIKYGSYHQSFADAVVKMKDYCESRGIPFYFVFDPEKISVYRRYLPAGVNYNDEWVDELLTNLKDNGVNVINNRDILIEKSSDEQVFNRKYDPGHWNDLGCFYGTNNLWSAVNEDFPSVSEYSLDEFSVENEYEGFLTNSYFRIDEEVPFFKLKTYWNDISEEYDGIKQNPRYPYFKYVINDAPNADKYPRMLVFQGSYYNRGPKFFIGRSKEYIGIHAYQNVLDIDYYVNIFQPEMVIFEVAEYTLIENYFNSTKMSELDYNPAVDSESDYVSSFENNKNLYVIQGEKIDTLYCDGIDSKTRYAYIKYNDKIVDLKKNEYGIYEADVLHEIIKGDPLLLYEEYDGDKKSEELTVSQAKQYVDENTGLPEGAVRGANNSEFILRPSIKDNCFRSINMQIFDAASGSYVDTVDSFNGEGEYLSCFISEYETGMYKVKLNINSSVKDEGIEVSAYLVKGEAYYYSFNVDKFKDDEVIISNFELFGACP